MPGGAGVECRRGLRTPNNPLPTVNALALGFSLPPGRYRAYPRGCE